MGLARNGSAVFFPIGIYSSILSWWSGSSLTWKILLLVVSIRWSSPGHHHFFVKHTKTKTEWDMIPPQKLRATSPEKWSLASGTFSFLGFSPFSKGWAVKESKHVVDFEFHCSLLVFSQSQLWIISSSGNPGNPAFSKVPNLDQKTPAAMLTLSRTFPTQSWRIFCGGFHNHRFVVKNTVESLRCFFWKRLESLRSSLSGTRQLHEISSKKRPPQDAG